MAVTNDFLPWATGGGANVESQAVYVADPAVPIGIAHGTASSPLSNKTWRQASVWAYCLGQLIVDQLGVSASDDGVVATLLANLKLAIINLAWSTGDAKLTYKATADTGWLMMADQTIGSGASGAAYANADALALFTLFFNNLTDANAPILTSVGGATTRGAQGSAAVAWGNNCRITLAKTIGRAIAIAGAGAGLTARTLGQTLGEETHTMTLPEMVPHHHIGKVPASLGSTFPFSGGSGSGFNDGNTSDTGGSAGAAVPFNVMQPTSFINVMIKK